MEQPPDRGVALVICPVFASGTPPLSLASLQPGLRDAGLRTLPFDLDFMLLREDAANHRAFFSIYNIGHPDGLDGVQFVIRPRFTLMALFPEAFEAAEREPQAPDLAIVAALAARLDWWAGQILAQGVGVVFCSVYVSNLLPSLLLARAIRARDPTVAVAFGGPGVGAPAIQQLVLQLGDVAACATGEGERVAPPLARALLDGAPLQGVPGIAFLDGGALVQGAPVPLIALSELPTPDFTGFPIPGHDVGAYRSNPAANLRWFGVALPIATTRGCVMRCTFCSESVYWKRYRPRDPEAVVAEIEALVARWGVRQFVFGDSLLNGTPAWLVRFAELCVERRLDVLFLFAYMRPTRLPRATLALLHAAGFRVLGFGMETASQALLDRMKKGTDVDEARQIYADCLDVGIHINLSVLCGIPGETVEDVMASVRFVQSLRQAALARSGADPLSGLTIHAGSPLRVEPYSPMYADPDAAGIRIVAEAAHLPPPLADLEPALSPLLARWTGSVDLAEVRARSALLLAALDREPISVFLGEGLQGRFDDGTVVRPVGSPVVLTDADGQHYLADGARMVARVDPFVAAVWPGLVRGEPFGRIRDAAAAMFPDAGDRLRAAFEGLLAARLVWVDDFA